ncbi:MAG: hypothetical protein ACI9A8_002206, partial [Cryomorphaceae bacterium]
LNAHVPLFSWLNLASLVWLCKHEHIPLGVVDMMLKLLTY